MPTFQQAEVLTDDSSKWEIMFGRDSGHMADLSSPSLSLPEARKNAAPQPDSADLGTATKEPSLHFHWGTGVDPLGSWVMTLSIWSPFLLLTQHCRFLR